jgi:hypothetical protein
MSNVSDFVSGAFKVLFVTSCFCFYILEIAVSFLTCHVLARCPLLNEEYYSFFVLCFLLWRIAQI